jgi:hypothetical protein
MTTHETKSHYGVPLTFSTDTYAGLGTETPLVLTVDYSEFPVRANKSVLVKRDDAIILRDMLIEALGAPEAEAPKATTSKLGEAVEFTASNGYTIIDRSPFSLIVLDADDNEKYKVGKYTVAALREYFDRPYVAPEPPVRFKVGDRVKLTGSEWARQGTAGQGAIVTIDRLWTADSSDEPYAGFDGWWVHNPDSPNYHKWGGELQPPLTLREQFDALKIGAQFRFSNAPGARVKVDADRYFYVGVLHNIDDQTYGLNLEEITDDDA